VGPLPPLPRKILCFGQLLTGSMVGAGVLTRVLGKNDGKKFFGRGSMLAAMVEAKFAADTATPMSCIALADNGAGVAAVWTVTFTGTATQAYTQPFYVGGPPRNNLTSAANAAFAVPVGMTAAQAATALAAAINALPDLPVTAAAAAGVVTITMRWKGASGNDLDLRTYYQHGDQVPAGLASVIAQTVQGSGNPVLTAAIAAMGTGWWTDIIMPYTDATSMAAIAAAMEARWGSTVQQDGMIWSFSPLSTGSVETLGASLNEKLQTLGGLPVCPTASWVCASIDATVGAYNLAIDPAAPLDSSITLPGIAAPASHDQLQHPDREAMLHDGISTYTIDDGGNVSFGRRITTYQTDPDGIPNQSYLDVEAMATLAYLRYWVRVRIATNFPRFKLVDDPVSGGKLPTGARVTCPKLIALNLAAGAQELYNAGIIDDPDDFAASLVVVRNSTNRDEVDAMLPYTLIGRFRVFAGQIQFRT
jgi:phage tail sheath gpL-like